MLPNSPISCPLTPWSPVEEKVCVVAQMQVMIFTHWNLCFPTQTSEAALAKQDKRCVPGRDLFTLCTTPVTSNFLHLSHRQKWATRTKAQTQVHFHRCAHNPLSANTGKRPCSDAHVQALRHTATRLWSQLCWWQPLSSSATVFTLPCCQPASAFPFHCLRHISPRKYSLLWAVRRQFQCSWWDACCTYYFFNETVISDTQELSENTAVIELSCWSCKWHIWLRLTPGQVPHVFLSGRRPAAAVTVCTLSDGLSAAFTVSGN